jgi:peroxiredoxin
MKIVVGMSIAMGNAACLADKSTSGDSVPTTSPPRSYEAIAADLHKERRAFHDNMLTASEITDPAKRAEAAPKLIPIMKQAIGYLRELKDTEYPEGVIAANREIPFFTASLALFGDKQTLTQLQQEAKGAPHSTRSVNAQASLLMVRWIEMAHDAAAQQTVLEEAKKLARDNPENDHLTDALENMVDIGPATKELSKTANDIALSMNTPMANQMKEQAERQQKLAKMENKPLTIEGTKVDGSHFSTADWKGKVVLVDFWATWCPTCMEEMPRVKKAYAEFHDKGLEIVGVSSDHETDQLKQFLAQSHDMPWPQLFDPSDLDWSPIARSLGVEALPTMFLIDKQGVVRSTNAIENFEEQIPKLLAEKE